MSSVIWTWPIYLPSSPTTHYCNSNNTSLLSIPMAIDGYLLPTCKSQPKNYLKENFPDHLISCQVIISPGFMLFRAFTLLTC